MRPSSGQLHRRGVGCYACRLGLACSCGELRGCGTDGDVDCARRDNIMLATPIVVCIRVARLVTCRTHKGTAWPSARLEPNRARGAIARPRLRRQALQQDLTHNQPSVAQRVICSLIPRTAGPPHQCDAATASAVLALWCSCGRQRRSSGGQCGPGGGRTHDQSIMSRPRRALCSPAKTQVTAERNPHNYLLAESWLRRSCPPPILDVPGCVRSCRGSVQYRFPEALKRGVSAVEVVPRH